MHRGNVFGSLKNKFSKKDEDRLSSTKTTMSGNAPAPPRNSPFSGTSPATRRPDRPGMNAFTTPTNEPPPAYSSRDAQVAASATAPASSASVTTTIGADDRYSFLTTFDTVFLIDDSGSMAGRSWRETGAALEKITPICTAHDADGIDIYFLNHPDSSFYKNITSAATITEIFQSVRPMGGTPTGQRINQILKPYLQRYQANPDSTKPLNIIVITDGEPSDDVESPIINAAKKLDKFDAPAWQVGIQFFQVGREPGAREHLKQLDDELAELAGDDDLRDIVDTVPFTGEQDAELNAEGILKVVLGAVNRRLDRKKSDELFDRPAVTQAEPAVPKTPKKRFSFLPN